MCRIKMIRGTMNNICVWQKNETVKGYNSITRGEFQNNVTIRVHNNICNVRWH